MRHAFLIALFGSCAVIVGSTLVLPMTPTATSADEPSSLHAITDAHSGHRQLCEVAKLGAAGALEALDFEGYRGWQGRIRASCLAAAAP